MNDEYNFKFFDISRWLDGRHIDESFGTIYYVICSLKITLDLGSRRCIGVVTMVGMVPVKIKMSPKIAERRQIYGILVAFRMLPPVQFDTTFRILGFYFIVKKMHKYELLHEKISRKFKMEDQKSLFVNTTNKEKFEDNKRGNQGVIRSFKLK